MNYLLITALVFLSINHVALGQSNMPSDTPAEQPVTSPQNPAYISSPDNFNTSGSDSITYRPLSEGGFFIEPMILVTQENTSIKTSQLPIVNDDSSGTTNGYGIGLRFGGHINEIFLLGLDARYAKTTFDDSFYNKADSNSYDIAPTLGIQTPYFGVRLLASYVVAGESNPKAGYQGLDLKFNEAKGWRVGAGLFIAAVSLNLEYQDLTYDSTEIQSYGTMDIDRTSTVDANNRGYTLSLSFPVEL